MDLSGKVVAITDAYSGLGAALSEELAKKGCKLVLGGRDPKKLEEFSNKIKEITETVSIVTDVKKRKDCGNFIKFGVKSFGRIDILINNAGVLSFGKIENLKEKDLMNNFRTNVFGPIWCAKSALKIMKKQKSGVIINIGSTSALGYKSSHIAYGSSKFALLGFTGNLAEDMKDGPVKVICFCPGGMKTNLFRSQSDRDISDFMDPKFVADYLINQIESDSKEWLIVLKRPEK